MNIDSNIVYFEGNYFSIRLIYKFENLVSDELKKKIVNDLCLKKDIPHFEIDEKDGFYMISDKERHSSLPRTKLVQLEKNKTRFVIGPRYTFKEWQEFRNDIIDIFFKHVKDSPGDDFLEFDAQIRINIPKDKIKPGIFSLLFPPESLISKWVPEDRRLLTNLRLIMGEDSSKCRLFLQIDTEETEKGQPTTEFHIGIPWPVPHGPNSPKASESLDTFLKEADSLLLNLNTNILLPLVS